LEVHRSLNDPHSRRIELLNNLTFETAAYNKKEADEAKAAAEKQAAEAKSRAEKAKAEQEKINAEKVEAEKKRLEEEKELKEKTAAEDTEFQKRINEILLESRLAAIKDENEKARAELIAQQEQELSDLAEDTKLRADQKLAIQKQLEIRNKEELDALELSFAEADAIRELDRLDEQMAKNEADFNIERSLLEEKQNLLEQYYQAGTISDDQYTAGIEANSKARIEIDKLEQQAKVQNAELSSQLLGTISDLVGKNTAAGKATAIAATTIDTYLGAQKAYASQLIPGDPSSPIRAAIAAAIAVAGGIKNVRAIARTPIPGGGGGASAPSVSASAPDVAPSVPTIGSSPVTALGTMMQNQPPLKAYVVESEVTGTQKRVADIERRAGF
jgi:hypothetical protein